MVYIMKELNPDMQIVMKLCDYFKVTPNEFLELKEDIPKLCHMLSCKILPTQENVVTEPKQVIVKLSWQNLMPLLSYSNFIQFSQSYS